MLQGCCVLIHRRIITLAKLASNVLEPEPGQFHRNQKYHQYFTITHRWTSQWTIYYIMYLSRIYFFLVVPKYFLLVPMLEIAVPMYSWRNWSYVIFGVFNFYLSVFYTLFSGPLLFSHPPRLHDARLLDSSLLLCSMPRRFPRIKQVLMEKGNKKGISHTLLPLHLLYPLLRKREKKVENDTEKRRAVRAMKLWWLDTFKGLCICTPLECEGRGEGEMEGGRRREKGPSENLLFSVHRKCLGLLFFLPVSLPFSLLFRSPSHTRPLWFVMVIFLTEK